MMLTNHTACAAACPDALGALGAFVYTEAQQSLRLDAANQPPGRRLDGHGRDITERHAMMNALCPIEAHVDCFFASADCVIAATPTRARPTLMDNCDVPMAVTVSMTLTMADPAAFVANAASAGAV
jgi:hypothetical protein